LQRIRGYLAGRRKIVFTGMAGVGKSVLLDYLSDDPRPRDYEAPVSAGCRSI